MNAVSRFGRLRSFFGLLFLVLQKGDVFFYFTPVLRTKIRRKIQRPGVPVVGQRLPNQAEKIVQRYPKKPGQLDFGGVVRSAAPALVGRNRQRREGQHPGKFRLGPAAVLAQLLQNFAEHRLFPPRTVMLCIEYSL